MTTDPKPADLIDDARSALGLTFHDFADFLGVQTSTLARWHGGKRGMPPTAAAVMRLAIAEPDVCRRVLASEDPENSESRSAKREKPRVKKEPVRVNGYGFWSVQQGVYMRLLHEVPTRVLTLDEARDPFDGGVPGRGVPENVQDAALLDMAIDGRVVLEPAPDGVEVKRPIRTEDGRTLGMVRLKDYSASADN